MSFASKLQVSAIALAIGQFAALSPANAADIEAAAADASSAADGASAGEA